MLYRYILFFGVAGEKFLKVTKIFIKNINFYLTKQNLQFIMSVRIYACGARASNPKNF